jgi:hypothetical protein
MPPAADLQLATPELGGEIYDFLYPHHFIHPDLDRDAFAACWRHQFFASGEPCVLVARDTSGKLVAHYGLMPVPYVVDGRSMRAGYFCQLFVDPQYRRTPLFFQMERKLLNEHGRFGFDFLHALIIIPTVLRQHLALGFVRGPDYHTFVFPLAAGSGWKAASPRVPPLAVAIIDALATGVSQAALALRRPSWRGIDIVEIASAAELDGDLLARVVAPWRMYADRGPRAIAHRVAPFGRKQYRIFAALAGSRHRGYIILRHTRVQAFDVAAIIDVMALPDDDLARNALLTQACRFGLEHRCHAVVAAAPAGTCAARHLNDNFFFRTPSHSTLLYSFPSTLAAMPPLAAWWSGWYDHDYI